LQFSASGGRIAYSSGAMVSLRDQRFEILRYAQNDERRRMLVLYYLFLRSCYVCRVFSG